MPDREADRRAILAIVAEHERGFNEKDPRRLAAGYRELSWAVDARGAGGEWEVVARQDTLRLTAARR